MTALDSNEDLAGAAMQVCGDKIFDCFCFVFFSWEKWALIFVCLFVFLGESLGNAWYLFLFLFCFSISNYMPRLLKCSCLGLFYIELILSTREIYNTKKIYNMPIIYNFPINLQYLGKSLQSPIKYVNGKKFSKEN